MDNFTYKNYKESAAVSLADKCLYGQILNIKDTVIYHANTVVGLEVEFHKAVDQYLAERKEILK